MYPFERFTERAKQVLVLAQVEAERAHHSYIGTEHLLLGLIAEGGGLAARALASLGVEGRVRDAIRAALGEPEPGAVRSITPTTRVKKVVECAFEEARRMDSGFVGTEHLLLGVLIEGQGLAAQVLNGMGVTLEGAREEIGRLAAAGPREEAPPPRSGRLPMSSNIAQVLTRASALAAESGATEVGLEHVERAIATWHAEHQ
jgi:ATP-dependent Clp protease ATP-binding subunit ClpC